MSRTRAKCRRGARPCKAHELSPAAPKIAQVDDDFEVAIGPPALVASIPNQGRQHKSAHSSLWTPFALALVATVIAALQISAGSAESQYLANAAREASNVGALAVGAGVRASFKANSQHALLLMQQHAEELSREAQGASPATSNALSGLAAAENSTAGRVSVEATEFSRPPSNSSELEAFLVAALSASEFDREPYRLAQERAVAAAEEAGDRSDRLVLALFLLTIGANVLEIGKDRGGPTHRRSARGGGWILCASAVLLTAYAMS